MATDTGAQTTPAKLDPELIKLAAILLVGAIAGLLDTTVVNVGLDAVARGLHTTVASTQWVMTGYLLSFGMVIPLNGWAIARFGAKATWLTSLAVFLAGSIACGAAWNLGSLVVFRVIQGLGGGMLLPVLTTLLIQAAGGRSLGRLMSAVSLPAVVVPIAGPVVGGLIVSNLSWRWLFYVNVPICLVALMLAWRGLPASTAVPAAVKPRLDLTGLALLSPGWPPSSTGWRRSASTTGSGIRPCSGRCSRARRRWPRSPCARSAPIRRSSRSSSRSSIWGCSGSARSRGRPA